MENKFESLKEKAVEFGALDAVLIDTDQVVFDPRAYLKCRFGCNRWGKFWTCPPHLEISPEMFMEAFQKYKKAIVIKAAGPESGQEAALALEKEAMLSFGCSFALAMILCVQCETCAYPDPCLHPHMARPSMDAYGIDIGKTLEPLGFKTEFNKEGKLLPAWYGMVLLD